MATALRIPFNRPALMGRELEYILDAIRRGHASGDGAYTRRCHALLEELVGAPKVLLTTSGTHALELAALLLDISEADEFVVPSFTFPSTANAFVLRGARPIFVDIRPDTLNLDEGQLESATTPRTKAIVVVHYGGVGCEMDTIMRFAGERGIAVVEDNAHGLFGRYRGRVLGSFGRFAAQSFHETKNVGCGEGGALILNDLSDAVRAEVVREKGTDRSRFFRGEVDKYTWVDVGSSYLPSDVLAAFLYAQLEAREEIQRRRRSIWERYRDALRAWADRYGVRLPLVPEHCEQPYHMFYLVLPTEEHRRFLIDRLRADGILAAFHYMPLHVSAMGRKLGGWPGQCPVTERISEQLVRLPFYNELGRADQDRVIERILELTW